MFPTTVGDEGMDGVVAVLVAIIGSAGLVGSALVGALVQSRRIGRGTGGGLATKWRDLHDAAVARSELMEEQRDDEHTFRLAAEERERDTALRLRATQDGLDDCVRQRQRAESDLAAVERRRAARGLA